MSIFFIVSISGLFILNYIMLVMLIKDNTLFTYKETLFLMIPFMTIFLFVVCMLYIMFEDLIEKIVD